MMNLLCWLIELNTNTFKLNYKSKLLAEVKIWYMLQDSLFSMSQLGIIVHNMEIFIPDFIIYSFASQLKLTDTQ